MVWSVYNSKHAPILSFPQRSLNPKKPTKNLYMLGFSKKIVTDQIYLARWREKRNERLSTYLMWNLEPNRIAPEKLMVTKAEIPELVHEVMETEKCYYLVFVLNRPAEPLV